MSDSRGTTRRRLGRRTAVAVCVAAGAAAVGAPPGAAQAPDAQTTNMPYTAWAGTQLRLVKCDDELIGVARQRPRRASSSRGAATRPPADRVREQRHQARRHRRAVRPRERRLARRRPRPDQAQGVRGRPGDRGPRASVPRDLAPARHPRDRRGRRDGSDRPDPPARRRRSATRPATARSCRPATTAACRSRSRARSRIRSGPAAASRCRTTGRRSRARWPPAPTRRTTSHAMRWDIHDDALKTEQHVAGECPRVCRRSPWTRWTTAAARATWPATTPTSARSRASSAIASTARRARARGRSTRCARRPS